MLQQQQQCSQKGGVDPFKPWPSLQARVCAAFSWRCPVQASQSHVRCILFFRDLYLHSSLICVHHAIVQHGPCPMDVHSL